MAARIAIPPTAFSTDASRRHKRPRVKNENHLDFIRSLPCIITGQHGVDAAHIRFADSRYGKRATGKSEKPDDAYTLPLSRKWHACQHSMSEQLFWQVQKIDPVPVAQALYIHSGNYEVCEAILAEARRRK